MKALSVIQPWAEAILRCGKDVENRSWAPPDRMLGEIIAIHASKKWDRECDEDLLQVRARTHGPLRSVDLIRADCGHIVGTARIVGIIGTRNEWVYGSDDARNEAARKSPWYFGPVGIVLAEQTPLDRPIPARGALGFWTVPADIERQITAELNGGAAS